MILANAMKLGFITQKTDVGAEKIDDSILKTHGMIKTDFLVQDRQGKIWSFKETFLLADTSPKMILGMLFFTVSDTDIWFAKKNLI